MPELTAPDVRYQESFLQAMAELVAEGRGSPSDDSMIGYELRTFGDTWADPEHFKAYASALNAQARPETPRLPGRVACTTWWWVEDDEYLGRIALRHQLNENLLEVGGHIGYDVRPTARRRGHATAMLGAVLPIAHTMGIDPALVTCDVDNEASRRTIEHHGGVLEDERSGKLRYWVTTALSADRE
jgi:predicted acetyltransferase